LTRPTAPRIEVEFERSTQQIIGPDRAHGLRFGDGSELMADLVARPSPRCYPRDGLTHVACNLPDTRVG